MELIIWEDPFDYSEDEFIDFIGDEEFIILSCCDYSLYGYET